MKQCAIIASVDKCRKCTESVQSVELVLSDADLLWPYQPLRLLTGSYREIGEHPLASKIERVCMNIVWVQVYRVRNRFELGGFAAVDQSCPYRPAVQRSAGQGREYSRGAGLACPRLSHLVSQTGELQACRGKK